MQRSLLRLNMVHGHGWFRSSSYSSGCFRSALGDEYAHVRLRIDDLRGRTGGEHQAKVFILVSRIGRLSSDGWNTRAILCDRWRSVERGVSSDRLAWFSQKCAETLHLYRSQAMQ